MMRSKDLVLSFKQALPLLSMFSNALSEVPKKQGALTVHKGSWVA